MRFKDSIITAGGLVFQQISSFVVGVYIARVIGSSEYGTLSVARNFVTILLTLTPLGLDLALLKYLPSIESDRSFAEAQFSVFRKLIYTFNLFVVCIVVLAAPYLEHHYYKFHNFSIYITLTILALPFMADINLFSAYYRTFGRPGAFSLISAYFQTFIRSLINLVTVWLGLSSAGVAGGTSLSALITVAVLMMYQIVWRSKSARTDQRNSMSWSAVRNVMKESRWMALTLFVYGLTRSADVMMLGLYVSAREVGSYGILSLISYLVAIFPIALSQTLGPEIARLYTSGDLAGIKTALNNYIRKASAISGFIFAGIAVFGVNLDLILGNSYHILPLLAFLLPLGYLVSATLAPMGYALSMTGHHKLELVILAAGGGCLILLLSFFAPMLGLVGAALAVLISFLFSNLTRAAFVARLLHFLPGKLQDLLPPLIGIALASTIKYSSGLIFGTSLISIVGDCTCFAITYPLILFAMFATKSERNALISMIRK